MPKSSNERARSASTVRRQLLPFLVGTAVMLQGTLLWLFFRTAPDAPRPLTTLRLDRSDASPASVPAASATNRQAAMHASAPSHRPRNTRQQPNRVSFQGMFGLGHMLDRMSAAYHLAQVLPNVTELHVSMQRCGKSSEETFPFLFGDGPIGVLPRGASVVESNGGAAAVAGNGKELTIVNDVLGYYSLNNYHDVGRDIPAHYREKSLSSPWWSKMESDWHFYQTLFGRYRYQDDVSSFVTRAAFEKHTVIGLHLRLGNGETAHWVDAGRGTANETEFIHSLAHLIGKFAEGVLSKKDNPPLVFLATDTFHLYSMLATSLINQHRIPTIIAPQLRLAKGEGVAFDQANKQGEEKKCLASWMGSVMDMILLSRSDVIIASVPSAFTRTMPRSMVFGRQFDEQGALVSESNERRERKLPRFCDVQDDARWMMCFANVEHWVFHDNVTENEEMRYVDVDGFAQPQERIHSKYNHKTCPRIVLPDVDPEPGIHRAVRFFERRDYSGSKMGFGQRFNPKYRFWDKNKPKRM